MTKERLNIYLEQAMAEVIRRAAELRGVSRAQVVVDLLESVRSQLGKMVELMEIAKRAPEAVNADLKRALDHAYDEIEPIATQSDAAFDTLRTNLTQAVGEAVDRTKRSLSA